MEKEFVPYELAVKLKELGFDEECLGWWSWINGNMASYYSYPMSNVKITEYYMNPKNCSAPLWQQAFDWFREQYKMNPTIISYWQHDWANFSYHYQYQLPDEYNSRVFELYEGKPCRTYEEARLECLKKLIEIIEEV